MERDLEIFLSIKNSAKNEDSIPNIEDPQQPLKSVLLRQYDPIFFHNPYPIHVASYYGALPLIAQFVQNIDVNCLEQTDANGRSAAHFAAAGGHLDILKYFADFSPQILTSYDKDSKSIVHYACEYDHLNIIKYAYSLNMPFSQCCSKGYPLLIACSVCSLPIVEYLCYLSKEHGVDIKINEVFRPAQTALTIALQNDFYEAIPILIDADFDINMQISNGWNLLAFAIKSKKIKSSRFLIDCGINVNQADRLNWMPLHIASQSLMVEVVDGLVQNGAQIACKTMMGMTPWMLAQNKFDSEETLLVLRNGIKTQITRKIVQQIIDEHFTN